MAGYSPADVNTVIKTVAGEGANQPPEARRAIASTILNRGAILGKPLADIASDSKVYNGADTPVARSAGVGSSLYDSIAKDIAPVFTEGPTTKATHFHSHMAKPPKWDDGKGEKIGDQVFFDRSADLRAKAAPAGDGPSIEDIERHMSGDTVSAAPGPAPVTSAPLPQVPGYIGDPADAAAAPGYQRGVALGGDGPSIEEIEGHLGGAKTAPAAPQAPPISLPNNPIGQMTGFMAQVNRGLGIGDEMAAGAATLGNVISGKRPSGVSLADLFKGNLEHQRQLEAGYENVHPHLSALGRGTGMAATVALPGAAQGSALSGVNMAMQGSRLGNIARGAIAGGLTGSAFAAADAGTPEERLRAAGEAARNPIVLALGAGAGALGSVAPKAASALGPQTGLAEKVAAFDQAGVAPSLAAAGGKGYATVAKAAAENPIAGIRARSALAAPLAQTQDAASAIAQDYGTALPHASAGEAAQAAIKDYAKGTGANLPPDLARRLSSRDITFGDKTNALYTRAERLIGDTQQIGVPNTTKAIDEVMNTFESPALAQRFKNNVLAGIGKDLESTGGQIAWRDAKNLRTSIRNRLMGDPQLSGTINDAQVGRIYGALTEDMRDGAAQLGGPKAAKAWDQANLFHRVGKQQIENQLTKVFDAPSGEAAYDSILRSAGSKGGADIQRLLAAKRAMGDGWGDIAATAAQRLGTDEHGAFSVAKFVTQYANLSKNGQDALFGSLGGGGAKATALKAQLDNLSKVAGMLKDVEAASNHSKSAVSAQTLATLGGLANPHTTLPTLGLLGSLSLSGEAMTNPAVVRWLAGMAKAKGAGELAKTADALGVAAQNNPQLAELYRAVTARLPRAAGVYGTGTSGTPSVAQPPNALANVNPAQ
jgi:hypothetical protein